MNYPIGIQDFAKLREMIMPPANILEDFDSRLEPLFSHLRQLNNENMELTKQRDKLLPLLMNGQVSV
jgi:type I restriction enzyme S subunit